MTGSAKKGLRLRIDDYDVQEFTDIAQRFGEEKFGFVVTPNVDHLIRYHDEPGFRESYAHASYVLLDSRFLAYLLRLAGGVRARVCPGSDLSAALLEKAQPDDRIVLIGCSDAQAQQLRARFGLRDLAHYNPPMGFIRDAGAV